MFEIDNCVCFITNKTSKKISNKFNERLLARGITKVQWVAMYFLLTYDELTQKELADKMDIKESTMTRLIDRMLNDDLINKIKHKEDRRKVIITLTSKGICRITHLLSEGEKIGDEVGAGISDEEFEIFNKVLNKMNKNIDNMK
ncbi:MAG: MarR family winged helix-turn-helix transcriptional regulator [Clostridiaceae bacterium]